MSQRSPALEPGNPARDGTLVFLVRLAELTLERGLFIENDKEFHRHTKDCSVQQKPRGAEGCSLAEDHCEHPDVHGIAYVPVKGSGHEKFRGRNGRGSAQSANGELPSTAEIDCRAKYYDENAEPREQARRWLREASQNPRWDQNQD